VSNRLFAIEVEDVDGNIYFYSDTEDAPGTCCTFDTRSQAVAEVKFIVEEGSEPTVVSTRVVEFVRKK